MDRVRLFWIVGCACGFLGVLTGAFGAHGLQKILPPEEAPRLLETWSTASRYALVHGLALLAAALLRDPRPLAPRETERPIGAPGVAGWSLTLGVLLFSGSLWVYVLTRFKPLVVVTPIGGVLLLIGWFALALAGRTRLRA